MKPAISVKTYQKDCLWSTSTGLFANWAEARSHAIEVLEDQHGHPVDEVMLEDDSSPRVWEIWIRRPSGAIVCSECSADSKLL